MVQTSGLQLPAPLQRLNELLPLLLGTAHHAPPGVGGRGPVRDSVGCAASWCTRAGLPIHSRLAGRIVHTSSVRKGAAQVPAMHHTILLITL